jgi:hypothetical protein
VDKQDVNAVGPEPPQAPLDGLHHCLAAGADFGQRRLGAVTAAVLRAQDHGIAPGSEQLADGLLRLAEPVARGRIDDVAACLEVAVQDLEGFLGRDVVPGAPE